MEKFKEKSNIIGISRTYSIRRDTEDRIITTGLKQHGVLRIRISGGDTCREPALLMG